MHFPDFDNLGLIAGMVTREDGSFRWPVIIGGIIASGSVAVAGWLISESNTIARIEARQEIVLQRLDRLEATNHPATAKRFTSDDARELEQRLNNRIDRVENLRDK